MGEKTKKDTMHKIAVLFIACLLFFDSALPSQSYITVPKHVWPFVKLDAAQAVIIRGVISRVECPRCDTFSDTIRLQLPEIDSLTDIEKKVRQLEFRKATLGLAVSQTCSCAIRQRINCPPCEFILSITDTFSLPVGADQVSFLMSKSEAQKIGAGAFRLDSAQKYIGKKVTLCGVTNSTNARIVISLSHLMTCIQFLDSNNCTTPLSSKFYYRAMTPHTRPDVDFRLELFKDLVRLDRAGKTSVKIRLIKNLMYHEYYLGLPHYFAKMVDVNLLNIDDRVRAALIAKQAAISRSFLLRQEINR
jgi:hypothetical protein